MKPRSLLLGLVLPLGLVLAACRAVLGIEDLHLDAAVADAGGDADAGLTDAGVTDADAALEPDACAARARSDCEICCRDRSSASTALFVAAHDCSCDAGGCAPSCPAFCPSASVDTRACTDCAVRSFLDDGGACVAYASPARCTGECQAFVACLRRCPAQ